MTFPVNIDGTWVNQTSYLDAGEVRRADAAMFAGTGASFGVGGGIARHGDTSLGVRVDGSDVVTIQPGAVVIPGNAAVGTGCYRFGLSAVATGSLSARNATNPRITLVVARYLDTDVVGSHGAFTGRIELIDGAPAGSPSVPSLPSMAVELARITVPATGGGAASVDASHCTYATAIGAQLVVPTANMLPASAATLQRARTLDTGASYYWNGTSWVADGVFAQAAGTTTVNGTSVIVGGFASVNITFPAGRFTVPPIVTLNLAGFVTNTSQVVVKYASSITTSGATLNVVNLSSGTISWTGLPLAWTAVQMTPTSAAG